MSKFKVGDKVQIKNWDEMENEFGLYCNGNIINCKASFTSSMIKLCGRVGTISRIVDNGLVYFEEGGLTDGYFISTDMIKLVKEPTKNIKETVKKEPKAGTVIYDGIRYIVIGDITIAIPKDTKYGISFTHPNDTYDKEIGYALAKFRMK